MRKGITISDLAQRVEKQGKAKQHSESTGDKKENDVTDVDFEEIKDDDKKDDKGKK